MIFSFLKIKKIFLCAFKQINIKGYKSKKHFQMMGERRRDKYLVGGVYCEGIFQGKPGVGVGNEQVLCW